VSKYHLKTLILKSGERLPMLVDDIGVPVHGPTVYAVAELRNRNRACNTMANALAALSVFQRFLDEHAVDLSNRLEEGQLLELGEIEALVRTCRFASSGRKTGNPLVEPEVCATRLRTIRKYLEWLVKGKLLAKDYLHLEQLQRVSGLTVDTINSRIPPSSEPLDPREGLAPEAVQRLSELFDPASPLNPWKNEHARKRNHLIWSTLYYLGVRAGELLGIRIRHIDLRKGTLAILRQADSPDDPRRRQPNAKTLARELEISEVLQRHLSEYILDHRRRLKNAHRHDFLFVSEVGDPLSSSALNKVFRVARAKYPDLPRGFTPHVLRHTWNDRFSEEMEGRKIDVELEKRVRSFQMGWKPTSQSAAVYTRRFVHKKAQEVSLSLQKKLMDRSAK
jgi:integrase